MEWRVDVSSFGGLTTMHRLIPQVAFVLLMKLRRHHISTSRRPTMSASRSGLNSDCGWHECVPSYSFFPSHFHILASATDLRVLFPPLPAPPVLASPRLQFHSLQQIQPALLSTQPIRVYPDAACKIWQWVLYLNAELGPVRWVWCVGMRW